MQCWLGHSRGGKERDLCTWLLLRPQQAGSCFRQKRPTYTLVPLQHETGRFPQERKVPRRLFFPGCVCRRAADTRSLYLLLIFSGGQNNCTQV